MEDQLDMLFQYWNKFDSKVLVSETRPTQQITIERLIAETTNYCRYSGRLTWILIDWLIRNINTIDEKKVVDLTKEHGDITVLGLVSDIAKQKINNAKFEYIIKASKPNRKKEVFFYRVSKSKLASRIAIEQTLPIYDKWNYYCNELSYLTTEKELLNSTLPNS
jgi:hypothetical protein